MAEEAKARGNALFGQKKYVEALEAYTEGTAKDPENHVLRANSSACFAAMAADEWIAGKKVALWQRALDEADACTKLASGRDWAKGYLRKSTAEFNLVAAVKQWQSRKEEDAKWKQSRKQRAQERAAASAADTDADADANTVDLGVAGGARADEEPPAAARDAAEDTLDGGAIGDGDEDADDGELTPEAAEAASSVTLEACEASCRAGLAIDPSLAALKAQLQALRDEGHATDAEADKSIVDAAAADACKAEGNAHFAAKRFTEAAEAYTRGLAQDPFAHVLYSNRSACYAALEDDLDKALRDADACVRIAPGFAKGYSRKATALYLLGRYVECEAAARAGLDVDPDNAALKDMLTKAQLETKESPEFQKTIHSLRQQKRQDAKLQRLLQGLNAGGEGLKVFGANGANGLADLFSGMGGGGMGGMGGMGGGGMGGGVSNMSDEQMRAMARAMSSAPGSGSA